MKVTKIEIKDFHQFKDLTIDLTYPKGHAKEGQPLDKVCFIGQSGTGKTSLLELIPKFLYDYDTRFTTKASAQAICNKIKVTFQLGFKSEYETTVHFDYQEVKKLNGNTAISNIYLWDFDDYTLNKEKCSFEEIDKFYDDWIEGVSSKLIYFPANLNYDIEIGAESTLDDKDIIDFSMEKISTVWNLTLEKIQKYQELELQKRQELAKTVEQASNNIDVIEKAVQKLKDWKSNEFNPIQDIAENCLNKLLLAFKLRVKTELDIKSKDDIGFIKVEDFSGNEIPHGLWSTGTKQVILSALPLYLLKPRHTVILFDEPERSLYPDMQRFIVDYYSSLADNCQFFYATHSPIIASNFEPWEIVELKFNKEGNVYREQYYEGENHVDNYKWNPKYMRWDDILVRVFDMENDGSDERKKKMNKLAILNVKFKKLDKQGKGDTDEAKAILKAIQPLSKELSIWEWDK